jgi:hypothetical protein
LTTFSKKHRIIPECSADEVREGVYVLKVRREDPVRTERNAVLAVSSRQKSRERIGMADIRIEVTTYEGYRGAERPSSFLYEGSKVEVLEILQMKVEEDHKTRKQKRFFIVNGSDQYAYTLYQDIGTAEWFLRNRVKKKSDFNP